MDGDSIGWNQASKKVTLKGSKTVEMVIGRKTMKSDNNIINMDVSPELKNGRTMLLARYVAEGLGYTVEWDSASQMVICYPLGIQKPDLTRISEEIEKNRILAERYMEIGKNGGFTNSSMLTDEMAAYMLEYQNYMISKPAIVPTKCGKDTSHF